MKKALLKLPVFSYFQLFYGYVGRKIYLLCFVIFLSGLLEGLGLSLLLPILNYQDQAAGDPFSRVVFQFLRALGVDPTLLSLLVLLFAVFTVKAFFFLLKGVISEAVCTDLGKRLRLRFQDQYQAMSYAFYTQTNIGYLNNIITTEITRAVSGFRKFVDLMVVVIYVAVYISVTFVVSWQMTLVAFVAFVVLFYAMRSLSRLAESLSRQETEKNARIQSLLLQLIDNFKYLKATNRFRPLSEQLADEIRRHCQVLFRNNLLRVSPPALIEPITVFFLALIIMYHVGYTGKPLSEIFVLLIFFYRAFQKLFGIRVEWQAFCSYLGGVEVLRDMEGQLLSHQEVFGQVLVSEFEDKIELKDVSFSYDSRPVLRNISLTVLKNKTIGLVGESGAGKTTLFDLLTGIIVPSSGDIRIDGRDYLTLDLRALRALMGYIIQDPILFHDTITNNISLWQKTGVEGPVSERVKEAARMANCSDFIEASEKGYDTVVGDKGIRVSGGQRQRLSIARELFKKPQIIILDEATSALDSESEQLIQESILSMAGKHTLIIAAHRLSTLKICDNIYVLAEGRIVEQGSFDALYQKQNGVFRKMCERQNLFPGSKGSGEDGDR